MRTLFVRSHFGHDGVTTVRWHLLSAAAASVACGWYIGLPPFWPPLNLPFDKRSGRMRSSDLPAVLLTAVGTSRLDLRSEAAASVALLSAVAA